MKEVIMLFTVLMQLVAFTYSLKVYLLVREKSLLVFAAMAIFQLLHYTVSVIDGMVLWHRIISHFTISFLGLWFIYNLFKMFKRYK